jgi:hypothetical protein
VIPQPLHQETTRARTSTEEAKQGVGGRPAKRVLIGHAVQSKDTVAIDETVGQIERSPVKILPQFRQFLRKSDGHLSHGAHPIIRSWLALAWLQSVERAADYS